MKSKSIRELPSKTVDYRHELDQIYEQYSLYRNTLDSVSVFYADLWFSKLSATEERNMTLSRRKLIFSLALLDMVLAGTVRTPFRCHPPATALDYVLPDSLAIKYRAWTLNDVLNGSRRYGKGTLFTRSAQEIIVAVNDEKNQLIEQAKNENELKQQIADLKHELDNKEAEILFLHGENERLMDRLNQSRTVE